MGGDAQCDDELYDGDLFDRELYEWAPSYIQQRSWLVHWQRKLRTSQPRLSARDKQAMARVDDVIER